jgi:hypothetical protein
MVEFSGRERDSKHEDLLEVLREKEQMVSK